MKSIDEKYARIGNNIFKHAGECISRSTLLSFDVFDFTWYKVVVSINEEVIQISTIDNFFKFPQDFFK
jgi:hypothetical protein